MAVPCLLPLRDEGVVMFRREEEPARGPGWRVVEEAVEGMALEEKLRKPARDGRRGLVLLRLR